MANGVWLYVVVSPVGRAATTKVPRLSDDEVVRFEFDTGTKLMTFVPVIPVLPTRPDVLKTRLAATGGVVVVVVVVVVVAGMRSARAEPLSRASMPRARA